jgi:repressor LexA
LFPVATAQMRADAPIREAPMLTQKQHDLLLFIHERVQKTGVSPSFDEMKDALDLKSKSGIHRLINALVERGFIRRIPHRARALEVLKLPEDLIQRTEPAPGFAEESPAFASPANENEPMAIPLVGKIAAGTPIAAIQHDGNFVDVPVGLLTRGEHFALEIEGDSMTGVGILDGDTVVIQRGDTAREGEIVVALVDDEEATLKTLRKAGGKITLQAENPDHESRTLDAGRVKVQGRLVGLLRRY